MRAFALESSARQQNANEFLRDFDGPSKLKKRAQIGGAATAVATPIVALFMTGQSGEPTVPFEELAPDVQARFERAVGEGQTALSFGMAGINDALLFFSNAYALHPNNPLAVRGLETVADRFLASLPDADPVTQAQVFGLLHCNAYLRSYQPAAAVCRDLLGATQCESIAARCRASAND
jgi:hypothetical protein